METLFNYMIILQRGAVVPLAYEITNPIERYNLGKQLCFNTMNWNEHLTDALCSNRYCALYRHIEDARL